jgi:lysophospholipid acyltransferase (LPLAT)-like uncharacterized protein
VTAAAGPDGQPPKRFLIDADGLRHFAGRVIVANFQRLVWRTNKIVYSPPDFLAAAGALEPAIYVTWHANVLAHPFIAGRNDDVVTLNSRHADGRMAAAYMEALGMTSVAGSGASERQPKGTGGVAGFRALLRAILAGKSLVLGGEVPPTPGRTVAPGVIAIARMSGRPLIPVAVASSRQRVIEKLWDKMLVNWPFGTIFVVAAPPIWVAKEDDEDAAASRLKVELDRVYAEAGSKAEAARRAPAS